MKKLLALAMLAFASLANAETLDLSQLSAVGCGTNSQGGCFVYDNAAEKIWLYWTGPSATSGTVAVYDYLKDSTGQIAGTVVYKAVLPYDPRAGISNAVLTADDGSTIVLSGVFSSVRRFKTGRGGGWTTYVTFEGGTLQR